MAGERGSTPERSKAERSKAKRNRRSFRRSPPPAGSLQRIAHIHSPDEAQQTSSPTAGAKDCANNALVQLDAVSVDGWAHGPSATLQLAPLHIELQRRIKRGSGTAMFVPEYHNKRPLGTVSKVTQRSLERKWSVERQAAAVARQEEEESREAVAAEKLRLKQRKEEIKRRAIAQREVCPSPFLTLCIF